MIRYNVLCVGAGGTGTYFLKEFAHFMSSFHEMDTQIVLGIVDGDRVERKNLDRQCFIEEDIGRHKAVVIGDAVRECYHLAERVSAFPRFIDTMEELKEIFDHLHRSGDYRYNMERIDILIGAVDNHRARQVFHEWFKKERTCIYFDSANEFSNGEVVFAGKAKGAIVGKDRAFYFPGIMKDRSPRASELSCGAVNISAPQHMVTNMMAANIMLGQLIPMLTEGRASFGITFFDAFVPMINFHAYVPDLKKEDCGADTGNRKKADQGALSKRRKRKAPEPTGERLSGVVSAC